MEDTQENTQQNNTIDNQPNSSIDDYAKMSAGAYGNKPVDGYEIDHELSSPDRTVYHKNGKAIVAFRGTDLSNKKNKWRDLGADALISLGLQGLSNRFKNAKKATDKTIQKYGKKNKEVVGHSLGGSQALYVGSKRGLKTNAFNAGISPVDVARSNGTLNSGILKPFLGKQTFHKDIHHHITSKDLVGGLSRHVKGLNTIIYKPKHKNAHSIKNFF